MSNLLSPDMDESHLFDINATKFNNIGVLLSVGDTTD